MELLTASVGSYPRIGDAPEQQKHRQAYARWERGEISNEEFEQVQDEVTQEVIEEQVRAGLDLVTDGQVRWYDPISHFARGLEGCEVGGLLRFFDTNFYFRQPVIRARVSWTGPIVLREFTFAKGVSRPPLKPVVTGPYTLAKLSIDRHYGDLGSLVTDFARAIGQEISELVKAGAEIVQVDEPAILQNPQDFELFRGAIEELSKHKQGAKLALYTYFGDAAPLYRKFHFKLPVDVLGFDFTYSPQLSNVIARFGCEKELGLGLIDGRNTKLEDAQEVLATLKKILPTVGSQRVYLSPSCGLGEYLPREIAFKKLQNLVAIAKKAKEVFR
jgi:5-methyltetrahydropteroyltriglutamate--homocysteine methyltransferase